MAKSLPAKPGKSAKAGPIQTQFTQRIMGGMKKGKR